MAPIFNQLLMRDPTGQSWLPTLLRLPEGLEARTDLPEHTSPLTRCAWWPAERQLPAPPSLLEALIDAVPGRAKLSGLKREQLVAGDPDAREEALRLLRARDPESLQRAWYVFEGPTSVDAYLETDELVVLIEGKRTERGPTTSTRYMPVRHQILRNLDAGWDLRQDRTLVAFFIVEGDATTGGLGARWQAFVRETAAPNAVEGSLPHRSAEERDAISSAVLGATTWQIVCRKFQIDCHTLPDEVEIRHRRRDRSPL